MIAAWILFPAVLALLCLGSGIVVEALAGHRLSLPLRLIAGYALIVVVSQIPAQWEVTAEFATPLIAAIAVLGLGLAVLEQRMPWRQSDGWPVGVACVVFVVFAAPVLFSGEPTVGGYIRLDDTASWLGITERALTDGTSLNGLGPSSYEAMLDFYLGSGYPLGGLLPLGIAGKLSGQDLIWVWQPYLAFLAALLALGLWEVTGDAIRSRPLRAIAVIVASQAATIFAYTLWGGFKEIETAALLPAIAALGVEAARRRQSFRELVPLAVVAAGLLGVLSVGGALWLAVLLGPLLVVVTREFGARSAAVQAASLLGLIVVMSLPALAEAGFLDAPAASTITTQDRLANLIQPLSFLQIFGVWPAADFRLRPDRLEPVYVLVGLVACAGAAGVALAWRRADHRFFTYVAGTFLAAVLIYAIGSPWVDAKALSVAAPACVLAAMLTCTHLWGSGRRPEGAVLLMAVAGGVVWSNVLAYGGVTLAPHERFSELATINERFDGQGPTLMTDFEPFAVRYLLRDMTPEGASELRRRLVPLVNGDQLVKARSADIDAFRLDAVLAYRTLVLRRSPLASRPPSVYQRARAGADYDVWQRGAASGQIAGRLPLGGASRPGGRPDCDAVARLGRTAGSGGTLVAALPRPVIRTNVPAIDVSNSRTASGTVDVARAGRYELWVPGATRSRLQVFVDGATLGRRRNELSYSGHFMSLGSVALSRGRHRIKISYAGADAAPGSSGDEFRIGSPVLTPSDWTPRTISRSPDDADELCGRSYDWIEAVRPLNR